jgi:hypothetical protein
MNIAPIRPVREFVTTVQGELRERREARAAYRALERELASYRTPREVDDLLGTIDDQDGPEAQQIRDILLDNLRPAAEMYRAS